MYSKGAKKVSTFDINPLTKHLFSLKKAALLADFSKEEYLDYFSYNKEPYSSYNNKAFSNESFYRIMPFLDEKSLRFWKKLYDTQDGIDIRRRGYLFSMDELYDTTLKQTLNYLDDENFNYLKEKASELNIDFINQDIKYLNLKGIYDFMYFSNIIQYVQFLFPHDRSLLLEKRKENMFKSLNSYKDLILSFSNNLSDGGEIIVGYIYTIFDDYYENPIFNSEIREQVFSTSDFSYRYFKSISAINDFDSSKFLSKEYGKDACLVYTKK